jgi:deazaflavin-dependent oxidoreductase (nitroreductase family)
MVRRIPRWIARLPVPLFRHGWGRIMGSRLALLEHRGRITGRPRQVVLEVLTRETGCLIVVSGYGAQAQWYRNILADPAVRVWSGDITDRPALAVPLPHEESRRILADYRARHPRAARALGRVLAIPELVAGSPLPATTAERLILVQIILDPATR